MTIMDEKKNPAAICGIFCGDCPVYLAPRIGDQKKIKELAQEAGLPEAEIGCDGCLSDRVFGPCRDCAQHGFRDCAAEHGVTWCFECDQFSCDRLENFLDIHVVNGISHHRRVIQELKDMKKRGPEEWAIRREAESCCSACSQPVYWSDRFCPSCRAFVR